LLDCVVFGRVAGRTATMHQLENLSQSVDSLVKSGQLSLKAGRVGTLAGQVVQNKTSAKAQGAYTLEEVAKHNKDTECWVIISG